MLIILKLRQKLVGLNFILMRNNMEMKKEICEKCKHYLSCMCGDEFEDCYIKNPNLKRRITLIVIE